MSSFALGIVYSVDNMLLERHRECYFLILLIVSNLCLFFISMNPSLISLTISFFLFHLSYQFSFWSLLTFIFSLCSGISIL